MSRDSLLDELGLEEDEVRWYHLSACRGTSINWFYDLYEQDKTHAKIVDEMCLSCPVAKQCLADGQAGKDFGVWGGVYLNLGRVDPDQNKHKTPEVWKALRKKHDANHL